MTTNELKCPVCGEGMKAIEGEGVYYCTNDKCEFGGIYSETEIYTMNALIQLRINKEKAAAVMEERERMEIKYQKLKDEYDTYIHAMTELE